MPTRRDAAAGERAPAADAPPHPTKHGRLLTDVAAGAFAGFFSVTACFSFGALIFSGPLAPHVTVGIGAALVTTLVAGLIVSLWGAFSFASAGPGGNSAALQATMVAGLFPALLALPAGDARPATALLALMAAGVLTGAFLFVMGWWRCGRLVRFVPFPVIAGFMAAAGVLMLKGAAAMIGVNDLNAVASLSVTGMALAAGTVGVAVLLLTLQRVVKSVALPALLIVASAGTHAGLEILGISPEDARAAGILFSASDSGAFWALGHLDALAAVDWRLLLSAAPDAVALAFVVAIAILVNATGLETVSGQDGDLDRQLRVEGLAAAAAGGCGGIIGHLSLSRSVLVWRAGGRGRAAGLGAGAVALATMIVGIDLVAVVPPFVLAGVLVALGLEMAWGWLADTVRRLPPRDVFTVVAIILLTVLLGLPAALIFGIAFGCIVFAVDVSRIGAIRRTFGLDEHPSRVEREPAVMDLIARQGGMVRVVQLHGYIFFGSAHRVYEYIRALTRAGGATHVIVDLAGVTGLDSSAGAAFLKMRKALEEAAVEATFCGARPSVMTLMSRSGCMAGTADVRDTLDEALEDAENRLLARHGDARRAGRDMAAWLAQALGAEARAAALLTVMRRTEHPANAWIARAGEPSETLFVVEHGRVDIVLEAPEQEPVRMRSLDRHTVVGEIGFLLDQPRTASIRASTAVVLWELPRPAFERLRRDSPATVAALYEYLFALQSSRLSFANRQIAALNRTG